MVLFLCEVGRVLCYDCVLCMIVFMCFYLNWLLGGCRSLERVCLMLLVWE